jgi:hypothetical protein
MNSLADGYDRYTDLRLFANPMLIIFPAFFSGRTLRLASLLIGEWSVTVVRNYVRQVDLLSRLTFEFHPKSGTPLIEGTVWRDDISSTELLTIDSFLLAHLELEFDTDLAGRIYTIGPTREFMSPFGFQPLVPGVSLSTRIRLLGNWSLDLRLIEGSSFTAIASTRLGAGTIEYVARKRPKQAVQRSKGGRWLIVGTAVVAAVIGVLLWKYHGPDAAAEGRQEPGEQEKTTHDNGRKPKND